MNEKVKIWLSVPKTHTEQVRIAIGDAGIGVIGNYSHCSFVTEGKGYFKPNAQANPTIGENNQMQEVSEDVIEFVCAKDQLPILKEVLDTHHPYEKVAVDVFPLVDLN